MRIHENMPVTEQPERNFAMPESAAAHQDIQRLKKS
jgi:hypothetical protein